jgi:prepilin-type N-terminal cleavage/methylation domain-containing protein
LDRRWSPLRVETGRAARSFVLLALLTLACTAAYADGRAAQAVDSEDRTPPVVLVLAPQSIGSVGELTVRVQVVDPSGPGKVALRARGEHEAEFRPYPMEQVGTDEFVASIGPSEDLGKRVVYYIEAYDRLGNGPTLSGNPSIPFVARLDETAPARTAGSRTDHRVKVALGLLVVVLGLLLRARVGVEERKTQVIAALERLPGVHDRAPGTTAPTADLANPAGDAEKDPDEQAFWLGLLAPLVNANRTEREQILARLSARPHHHPVQGKRFYDRHELARKLAWVQDCLTDAAQRNEHPGARVPERSRTEVTRPGQRGVTLVELIVVVAVIGLCLGLAAASFAPMQAPLRSGCELVDGMLRYTRARAVSTTTPHRLRPISPTTLVVESGPSCSAGPWVLDPARRLDLPQGVSLPDTSWSVCFVSRGLAPQNQLITLHHPVKGSQQLEVLVGGAVLWLP